MDRQTLWNSVDSYKRKIFLKNEIKRIVLKSISFNKYTSYSRRYLAKYFISTLPRFASITVVNNRCVYSGRSWGVNKKTGMSRFVHRNKVYSSDIPGCKKASW